MDENTKPIQCSETTTSPEANGDDITRRRFLQVSGTLGAAVPVLGAGVAAAGFASGASAQTSGPTLLVKNIHTLVTMDDQRREIRNGALFVRGNVIEAVGTTA